MGAQVLADLLVQLVAPRTALVEARSATVVSDEAGGPDFIGAGTFARALHLVGSRDATGHEDDEKREATQRKVHVNDRSTRNGDGTKNYEARRPVRNRSRACWAFAMRASSSTVGWRTAAMASR